MFNLPREMTVIEIAAPGGAEALIPGRRPVPAPGAGEVLIEVRAAGVNRPDVLQRAGHYPPPPGASDIPGLEVAGRVVAVGEDVTWPKAGDAVAALVTGGGYAEYALAPAPQCLPVPQGLSFTEAAALPETFFTVWSNLFDRAGFRAGETVLIHGGSSGIGTTAIQLVCAFGGTAYVTAGSAEKCAACERLGASRAINYREEDFVEVVAALTQKRGADIILDMVGGDYIPKNLKCLASDGRLVFIAFLKGAKAEVDFMPLMRNRFTITGSTLRPRPVAFKAEIAKNLREKVWPLIEEGKIRPVIHRTFPLEAAAQAHALMESSGHIGKIVLETHPVFDP
jgi:putative PIG3 family NAD(P)H quinone oxidoreductase